jgi:hypothetical protein
VNIGTRKVPVRGEAREVRFSGGAHGKKERGIYRFWTLVGEDDYGPFTIIGRARRNLDAGDRIARMSWTRTAGNPAEHRRIYRRLYQLAQEHGHYVRASTLREIARWAGSHEKDWALAQLSYRALVKRIP